MTFVKMKLCNLGRETSQNVQQNRASAKTLEKVEDEVQPSLGVAPHAWFCSCCLCFWCHTHEFTAKTDVMKLFPSAFFQDFTTSGPMSNSLIHLT